MVAKITIPKSIEAALNYNEKKVQKGTAECLYAGNYLKDVEKMNFYQKLDGFETNNRLNKMSTTKTLHVSLNFDPSENLSKSKLIEIASVYMDKIGFREQPFLVYRHEDAGHPHIHIVSTTIKNDGSRINTHNIGKNQSERARKEIEQAHGLVRAEGQHEIAKPGVKPVSAEKTVYGISETKKSISNIVSVVFSQYKFASLPEFNAALKQFNVVADRGKEDGKIYKHRGLVYRILDAHGNKVGVPIKASALGCKPILDNLEQKFAINDAAKESLKQTTKNTIDGCMQTSPGSLNTLIALLRQEQIYTVLRQNAEGRLYGITFVDNQNKVVFNGSDLGKGYSAAALLTGLNPDDKKVLVPKGAKHGDAQNSNQHKIQQKQVAKANESLAKNESLLETLMTAKEQFDNVPKSLLQKKRKKKRKPNW